MKKLFTLPNLYVLLWALFSTQGTFIPLGSIWSRGIILIFLLISFHYMVNVIRHKQSPYFKALGTLLLLFTVYGVAHIIVGGEVGYLEVIYLSLLPIYTFFVLTKDGKIDENWIRVVFFITFGVVIIQYMSTVRYLEETLIESDKATVNVGYEIVALIPLIYFFGKRPIVQYALLALIVGLVVTTIKRGAIIVSALCTLYFIYNALVNSKRKSKWYIWLLVLLFVVVGTRYVIDFYNNSEYAQMRMEYTMDGGSSGRDSIFSAAWNVFLNSNIIELLFGHGALATVRIIGIAAHNDWLEILVNQGILGVTIYFFYWAVFYKTFRRAKNDETQPVIGSVMIIYSAATLFSMSYSAMTLPSTLALGYALASADLKKRDC